MRIPPEEIESLLLLSSVPGIGPNRIRALFSYFHSFSDIFRASVRTLIQINGIEKKTAQNIKKIDNRKFVDNQLKRLEETRTRFITFWDDDYPEPLKQIYDPPAFLFVQGEFLPHDKYAVAIVGTRQPSSYGKVVTEKIVTALSRFQIPIISGLAYGVDTIAHRTALNTSNRTIAVFGSGVDVVYPYENSPLAQKIRGSGALVSEFALGTKPDRNNFPRRNRIVCGMALGVVVVEAGKKSGALITAAMALEQNREVFAVPGNIDSPSSFGTNTLLKQGATIVTSADDIIDELYPKLEPLLKSEVKSQIPVDLTVDEKHIYSVLSNEPTHIDLLSKKVQMPSSKALSVLLTMELKNLIKQLPGKQFVKL